MNPAKIRITHIPNSSGTAKVTCVDNVAWPLQYPWGPPAPSEWLSVRWRDFGMTANVRSRSCDLRKWRHLMKLKTVGRIKSLPIARLKGERKEKKSLDRPWGFQEFEVPRFQESRHMKVVRFSALRNGRLYVLGDIPDTNFCYSLSVPQGQSATGRLNNANYTIANRTRELPAWSAVPQPTVPPRATLLKGSIKEFDRTN